MGFDIDSARGLIQHASKTEKSIQLTWLIWLGWFLFSSCSFELRNWCLWREVVYYSCFLLQKPILDSSFMFNNVSKAFSWCNLTMHVFILLSSTWCLGAVHCCQRFYAWYGNPSDSIDDNLGPHLVIHIHQWYGPTISDVLHFPNRWGWCCCSSWILIWCLLKA